MYLVAFNGPMAIRDSSKSGTIMTRVVCIVCVTLCGLLLPGCTAVHDASLSRPDARVRKVASYAQLKQILEQDAQPGDIIEVEPGIHYATSPRITVNMSGTPDKPITIRGVIKDGRRPVIDGARVNTNRGLIVFPVGSHDVIVENLELRHAVGMRHEYNSNVSSATTSEVAKKTPGLGAGGISASGEKTYGVNAGAMFFEGANITVRNCFSHHNEDGWFATKDADYILIENCEIGWNGTLFAGPHNATHNFYFCAKRQMVKNCYIHDPRDAQNFKSRGQNTIFAFNWVDEDHAYSVEQASNGSLNTLWLGNVIAKRSSEGLWQGRLLGIGDGSGVVHGTVVAVNNTFVSFFPRDHFFFTFPSGDANLVLINNVFAGPAENFAYHNGKGSITGANNWIRKGVTSIPASLENTTYGDDPGFTNSSAFDFRPAPNSPLIDAGASSEKYSAAIALVLANATSATPISPSAPWLAALEDIKAALPRFAPRVKDHGFGRRVPSGTLDIGAFEAARPAK
jgi:hypothetical protein